MTATSQAPDVGAALRRCRQRAGISQERLADRAGVARTYVGRVERRVLNPTLVSMHRLLGTLGLSWTQFGAVLDEVDALPTKVTPRTWSG